MRLRKKPWIQEAIKELENKYIFLENIEGYKGQWRKILQREKLALEIGSGKGDFITGMAEIFIDTGFIGIETQTDIAYYPAHKAKEKNLENVKVICGNAVNLEEWFEENEIDMLYLNFSDPWPKARHYKRRLTYRDFLAKYQKILKPDGHLRFKTDNKDLFDFSIEEFREFGLEIIALSYDLHNSNYLNEVQTEYERKFSALGKKINFCEVIFHKN